MRTSSLTPEMQAEIDALAALSEEQIDTDDIPEATLENMKAGERGRYFRPNKASITIRLDADLIDWFKSNAEGGGYQTEINRVLREHMLKAARKAP